MMAEDHGERPEARGKPSTDDITQILNEQLVITSRTADESVESVKNLCESLKRELEKEGLQIRSIIQPQAFVLQDDPPRNSVGYYYLNRRTSPTVLNENNKRVKVVEVLNPLEYAMHFHEEYMRNVPEKAKILFVGMNPSPKSMTGIPFFESTAIAKLFRVSEDGLLRCSPVECRGKETSESGRRFWKFVLNLFGSYEKFFNDCFVINYCPLIFIGEDGCNIPLRQCFWQKSPPLFRSLQEIVDSHFRDTIDIIKPELIIGIGSYAFHRVKKVVKERDIKCCKIDHPSPISGAKCGDWLWKVRLSLADNPDWNNMMEQICPEEADSTERTFTVSDLVFIIICIALGLYCKDLILK